MRALLLCAAFVALLALPTQALTTKIDAGAKWCFRERVGKDIPLSFNFKVTAGGKLDLDADIHDTSGRLVHDWKMTQEGHYTMRGDASNNKFTICFRNEMARFTPKWVNFNVHHGVPEAAATKEHLDPLEGQIERLMDKMKDLREAQDELRTLEHDHRNTVEDANERVLLWSVIETACLIVMGLLYIFFLKRFLEVRTSM